MKEEEFIDIIKQYPLSNLKVFNKIDSQIQEIQSIDFSDCEIVLWSNDNYCIKSGDSIILKPLSLLTATMMVMLTNDDLKKIQSVFVNKDKDLIKDVSFRGYKILLDNYYDVNFLIEKGLAISIEDERLKDIKIY